MTQLPGFAADASLYRSERNYQTAASPVGLSGGQAFLAQIDLGPQEGADEMGEDCMSECLEAGGSAEECMEQCSTAEMGEEA